MNAITSARSMLLVMMIAGGCRPPDVSVADLQTKDDIQSADDQRTPIPTWYPDEIKNFNRSYRNKVVYPSSNDEIKNFAGVYWSAPATAIAIEDHKRLFKLELTNRQSYLVSEMFVNYPREWPDLSDSNLEWYAWPGNTHDGDNYSMWRIMAVDVKANTLYFYYESKNFHS